MERQSYPWRGWRCTRGTAPLRSTKAGRWLILSPDYLTELMIPSSITPISHSSFSFKTQRATLHRPLLNFRGSLDYYRSSLGTNTPRSEQTTPGVTDASESPLDLLTSTSSPCDGWCDKTKPFTPGPPRARLCNPRQIRPRAPRAVANAYLPRRRRLSPTRRSASSPATTARLRLCRHRHQIQPWPVPRRAENYPTSST